VDPSMSVKSRVTVPVGRSGTQHLLQPSSKHPRHTWTTGLYESFDGLYTLYRIVRQQEVRVLLLPTNPYLHATLLDRARS
jgi:hypothetical protein